MTKIYINLNDKNTNNYLSSAIRALESANNKSFSVPSDFAYSNKLVSVRRDISYVKSALEETKTWLENSQKDYEKFINNCGQDIGRIPKVNLKKAESIVK